MILDTLDLFALLQKERGTRLLSFALKEMDTPPISLDSLYAQTTNKLATIIKNNPDIQDLLPEHFFELFYKRSDKTLHDHQTIQQRMEGYTYNLEHPVHQVLLGSLARTPHFSPAQTSALIHYIAALGYLCQIRDTGALVYAHAEITHKDIRLLKHAAQSYMARERLFLSLADEKMKQKADQAKNPAIDAIGRFDEILRNLRAGQAKSVLAETPLTKWSALMDTEHTALHKALKNIIEMLTEEGQDLATQSAYNQALDQDVDLSLPLIGTLPLFRGLSELTLRTLLKGARLHDLEKNTLFLRQGEQISRAYILMDGWAKAYKTNAEGQESILQILSRKEPLLDAGLLHNSLSGLNAKSVTRAKILSLPLSVLKDHVSRNRELAQNMLTSTQARLGRLATQYEQLTLHNATQRVGAFLVNLYLETGLEGEPLRLPFDKALIAAYLNIKPETFSRILKEFRNQGFVIHKQQIELPHPHALCTYCDPDSAMRCCRAEMTNCAPIQTARKLMQKS